MIEGLELEIWHAGLTFVVGVALTLVTKWAHNKHQNKREVPRRAQDNGSRQEMVTRKDFDEYKEWLTTNIVNPLKEIGSRLTALETKVDERTEKRIH